LILRRSRTRRAIGCWQRGALKFAGVFLLFKKVGDVEEGVALQANVDKCRLHAWQDAGDLAFVHGAGKGVFVFAFVMDFDELFVFNDGETGFVRSA